MTDIYKASPVQAEFHLCSADEAMIGGSGGPGKSLALLMDPFMSQIVSEHERWQRTGRESEGKAIHFRREFPMLTETIDRSHRLFPKIDPKCHWDGETRTWRWSCGYKQQFAHLKESRDWQIYDSNQWDHVSFDELWQFEFEQYIRLVKRCRSADPILRKLKRVRSATIPAGNWVREYFVDPAPKGRKLMTRRYRMDDGSEEVRTRVFIPALLRDNPDVEFRRDYEVNLRDSPAHIRLALLNGDWYVVAGAFFAAEFEPSVHVVKPFRIPSGWKRFRSMDWGYKNPGCVLWWAVDTDENLTCYREYTFKGKDSSEVAAKVMEIEDNAGEWDNNKRCSRLSGPADTQIWEQRGTIGPTIAETMSMDGVWWEKCTKNRLASVQQLMHRLKDRSGENKIPGIRFFDTCKNTLRTLPAIGTDANNAELPADGGEDHWLDTVLYACMYRMIAAKQDVLPHGREFYDDLGMARARAARRQVKGGKLGYGGY